MPAPITMPQLSDTMTEGTVVKWLKKEGDKVNAGDIVAEVETDKATMEMESFESGTLAVIKAKEGQKVKVGDPIALLATGKESVQDVKSADHAGASREGGVPAPAAQTLSSEQEEHARGDHPSHAATATAGARESRTATGASRSTMTMPAPEQHRDENGESRVRISPLARRLAAERGIDLSNIRGSGPGGRIVQKDVESALAGPAQPRTPVMAEVKRSAAPAAPLPARVPLGQKQVIPLTKMRATIAQRLQQSKQQIPHFYETIDADVEDLVNLRASINQQLEAEGIRLSLGDFVAKAVAVALQRHPQLNAHLNANEITRFGDVNLGMAVALPEGLIVPVLRNIDQMGLREIRQRSADLIDRARTQKLKGDELTGATFTVSNLGTYGVKEFSAIINPPEVGILAVAAAQKQPVVKEDSIVARTRMSLTLSADHRAVDGASAAEFMRTLKQLLEEPGMMLV